MPSVMKIKVEPISQLSTPSIALPFSTMLPQAIFKVGSFIEYCNVEQLPTSTSEIRYCSRHPFAQELNGLSLNYKIGGSQVHLGPLIGMFVNKGTINSIVRGQPKFRLTETSRVNQWEHTLIYLFTIGDVDLENHLIHGYHYRSTDNQWVRCAFPYPDVLWDRGGGFLEHQEKAAYKVRKSLYKQHLIRLNTTYHFSKWAVHKKLSQHESVAHYLPNTVQYNSKNLAAMLSDCGDVYVKDVIGSNGRSVMRIQHQGTGYDYSAFRNQLYIGSCKKISELVDVIKDFFKDAQLIVQQGIQTISHQGRKVDFRALMQRDLTGNWKLTAIPMRIGGENSPITSTASGSTVVQVWDGLIGVLGYSHKEAEQVYNRMVQCLNTVVPFIELEYGRFGELGIDLALDTQGKVWFIECNSKPGKDTVVLAGNQTEVDNAFARPLQYIKYLTGFYGDCDGR